MYNSVTWSDWSIALTSLIGILNLRTRWFNRRWRKQGIEPYFINQSQSVIFPSQRPLSTPTCRQRAPIKVNKRLTIHPANGKVRKQKRTPSVAVFPPQLLLIIKQTFSRLDPRIRPHFAARFVECQRNLCGFLFQILETKWRKCPSQSSNGINRPSDHKVLLLLRSLVPLFK